MISLCCCEKITVSMESQTASANKYGFGGYEGAGWFRKEERMHNFSGTSSKHQPGLPSSGCSRTTSFAKTDTVTRTLPNFPDWNYGTPSSSVGGDCPPAVAFDCSPCTTTENSSNTSYTKTVTCSYSDERYTCSTSDITARTLSDEYTTKMLIDDIENYLNALTWTEVFGALIAGIHVSEDEYSCSIVKFRFKFVANTKIPAGKRAVIAYDLLTVDINGQALSREPREAFIDAGKTDTDWIELPVKRDEFYRLGAFAYVIKDA